MYLNFSIILFFRRKCYQVGAYFWQIWTSPFRNNSCLCVMRNPGQKQMVSLSVQLHVHIVNKCVFRECTLIFWSDTHLGNLALWVSSNWSINFCHCTISASFWGNCNCGIDQNLHVSDVICNFAPTKSVFFLCHWEMSCLSHRKLLDLNLNFSIILCF